MPSEEAPEVRGVTTDPAHALAVAEAPPVWDLEVAASVVGVVEGGAGSDLEEGSKFQESKNETNVRERK